MSQPGAEPNPRLIRALGPMMATAVIVGTVIGSGIFKKPQAVAQVVPFSGPAALVWISGGLLTLLGALAFAEIAVLYPRAGGNYVFLREAFGRLAGFLWAWIEILVIKAAAIAALASVFADCLCETITLSAPVAPLEGYWMRAWLTVGVVMLMAFVNVAGVRWSGRMQLAITVVKVAALAAIIVLPFVVAVLGGSSLAAEKPSFQHLEPIWPESLKAVDFRRFCAALFGVLWAYHGWMNIAPVAEEVRDPRRNIPLALFAGVAIVIAAYVGANLAYGLVLPATDMASLQGTTVATAFFLRLFGAGGAAIASSLVAVSVFGALNGNLLAGPRVLYALGVDGLTFRYFSQVHPRFRTPHRAILLLASWSALLVLAGAVLARYGVPILDLGGWQLDLNVPRDKRLFDIMTDFAMFGAVTFETLAVATIFVFRRRRPDAERAYRCWGYPWVPGAYVAALGLVALSTFVNQRTEALAGLGFIGLGALVYWLMARR